MKVKISKDETIETDRHSMLELSQLRDILINEQTELNAKIIALKHRAKSDGVYEDKDIFQRINYAKKKNGIAIEALKIIISDRRKATNIEQSTARNNLIRDYFIEVCKERMPKDLYGAIFKEAEQRFLAAQERQEEATP